MNILLAVAHFFKPLENAKHSSQRSNARAIREEALHNLLLRWRSLFAPSVILNHTARALDEVAPRQHVDIVVAVHGDNHCLTPALERQFDVEKVRFNLKDPRMLPFTTHRLLARRAGAYDWFVYSEDDIGMVDPGFFYKMQAFQNQFGPHCLLQPNRYEINARGLRMKTYPDGDLGHKYLELGLQHVPHVPLRLDFETERGKLPVKRLSNPHTGLFALSAAQMACWMEQKHFLDMDTSFISPLESAATLGLMKTFAVFKPAPPHLDYFEVEHLSPTYSHLRLPVRSHAQA